MRGATWSASCIQYLGAPCGIWLWATTVSIELFSVELEAFAREVGASPTKQIVLVLDGAGWADWA